MTMMTTTTAIEASESSGVGQVHRSTQIQNSVYENITMKTTTAIKIPKPNHDITHELKNWSLSLSLLRMSASIILSAQITKIVFKTP